MKVAVQILCIL